MIEYQAPKDWKVLQNRVAQILLECGLQANVERTITTARGEVKIDVWAHDESATPAQNYVIECKQWKKAVPKTVVHAFRSVVGDSGANWGAIVSSRGFQSGALKAAQYSNVRLLSWEQFQQLFAHRWYERFFVAALEEEALALSEYAEPINTRVFRKADALRSEMQQRFVALRQQHAVLEQFCLGLRAGSLLNRFACNRGSRLAIPTGPPTLPLRERLQESEAKELLTLSDEILDATSLRQLLELTLKHVTKATAEFDAVFGERA